jgi:HK97 family phage major capsid protein
MSDVTLEALEATKTVEEVVSFLANLKARSNELDAEFKGQTFDEGAQEEFASLRDLKKAGDARKAEFEARRTWIEELAGDETRQEKVGTSLAQRPRAGSRIPDDLFDLSEYRARTHSEESMVALMRDGARKVAEQAIYPHDNATPDKTVGHIHKLLAKIDGGNDEVRPGMLARHILATGSPAYSRAFGKAIAGMGNHLTPEERAAIATVGTTTTGGYAVPFTLDPTVILTSDGALNPLPGIARNEQTVGNTWKGLASAGVTASYGTEAVAVTDGSPTFTQPEVTVRKAKALIEFSIESDQDWPRLQSEMARLLQDAKDTLEAEKFVNGTGSNEPEGVLYGIASTYNVGTTGDGFDTGDLRVVTTRLGDRWEPRASWLAHRAVYTEAERLDAASGINPAYRPLVQGEPRSLLGYPRYNTSAMESDFATGANRVAIFGDFQQFLIVTKIGLTVELIPHLVNGDGNPTGERGLFAYWRNSSVVLVDSAFRVLTIGVVTTGI